MPRRNRYSRQNRHSTGAPRRRRTGISAIGIFAFSTILGLMFAAGAGITAIISMSSGGPMVIAHALLAVSGSCFFGGIFLAVLTRKYG